MFLKKIGGRSAERAVAASASWKSDGWSGSSAGRESHRESRPPDSAAANRYLGEKRTPEARVRGTVVS